MTRRILQLLVLAACTALLAAPAAFGQATGATGAAAPTVVEPTAGKPAPAPVDTTPVPVPVPVPTAAPAPQPTTSAAAAEGSTGAAGPQAARKTDGGLSNAALAIIAVAALLALLTGLVAFASWRGWSSRRLNRWRHAAGEANWRMGLRMAEFRDFLRLGR